MNRIKITFHLITDEKLDEIIETNDNIIDLMDILKQTSHPKFIRIKSKNIIIPIQNIAYIEFEDETKN